MIADSSDNSSIIRTKPVVPEGTDVVKGRGTMRAPKAQVTAPTTVFTAAKVTAPTAKVDRNNDEITVTIEVNKPKERPSFQDVYVPRGIREMVIEDDEGTEVNKQKERPSFQNVYVPRGKKEMIVEEDEVNRPKERPQFQGVYVPRGRREMVAEDDGTKVIEETRKRSDSIEKTSREDGMPRGRGTFSFDKVQKSLVETQKTPEKSRPVPVDPTPTDHDVDACCFVVRGFPPELPSFSKERMLKPYTDVGADIQWISSTEALAVFLSASQAKAAMALPKNSLIYLAQVTGLSDKDEIKGLLKVGNEMHARMIPERDTSAANRMIGAALGVRIKTTSPLQKHRRTESPPKVCAWD